jgi:hypothetical protein
VLQAIRSIAAGDGAPSAAAGVVFAGGAKGGPKGEPGGETPRPSVLVEALTEEKATLRVEAWTGDARDAVPRLAWALRRRIPGAEITVLE